MIKAVITIIVTFALPLPIWMILLHLAIFKNTARLYKTIIYFSLAFAWLGIGSYLFAHPEILFGQTFATTPVLKILGLILILIGLAIDFFVIKVLGWQRISFFTEYQEQNEPNQLIVKGIYRYARHPRYVEYPLVATGFALLFGYTALLYYALYIFLGLWLVTYFEEKELIKRFGRAYLDYRQKVPRFFIKF